LATKIGKPIGYNRCEIRRHYEPGKTDRFGIPIADISALLTMAGANPTDCDGMIAGLLQPKMCDHLPSRVENLTSRIRFEANGMKVVFDIVSHTVANRHDRFIANRDFDIRIEDGFLTGRPARIAITTGTVLRRWPWNCTSSRTIPTTPKQRPQRVRSVHEFNTRGWRWASKNRGMWNDAPESSRSRHAEKIANNRCHSIGKGYRRQQSRRHIGGCGSYEGVVVRRRPWMRHRQNTLTR
jgi:hypothetical protein